MMDDNRVERGYQAPRKVGDMKIRNLFATLALPVVMITISGCNHQDNDDDRDVGYAEVGEMRIDERPHTKHSKQSEKLILSEESPAVAARYHVGEMDLE
jgi:hypothetical protein